MKILGYIFSLFLWGVFWITAFVSIVLALLLSLVLPKRCYNAIVRFICRLLSTAVLLFPKVVSRPENVPYPCIYVGNHVSFFDLFICGSVLPGDPRGMELKSHFYKPIYGWFISRFGEIPIDKDSPSRLRSSFRNAGDILKSGQRSILIMPEGTRTRTGAIGQFGIGAFFLAKMTNMPVVPVVFDDLYEHNNALSIMIRPGRVNVRILNPVYSADYETEQLMSDAVRNMMTEELHRTAEERE